MFQYNNKQAYTRECIRFWPDTMYIRFSIFNWPVFSAHFIYAKANVCTVKLFFLLNSTFVFFFLFHTYVFQRKQFGFYQLWIIVQINCLVSSLSNKPPVWMILYLLQTTNSFFFHYYSIRPHWLHKSNSFWNREPKSHGLDHLLD